MIRLNEQTVDALNEMEQTIERLPGPPEDVEMLRLSIEQARARLAAEAINKRFGAGQDRDVIVEIDQTDGGENREGDPLPWHQVVLSSVLSEYLDLRQDGSLYAQAADRMEAWARRILTAAAELREAEEQA